MPNFVRKEDSDHPFSCVRQPFPDLPASAPAKVVLLTQDAELSRFLGESGFRRQLQQQNIELVLTQSLSAVQAADRMPVLVTEDMAGHLQALAKGRRVVVFLSDRTEQQAQQAKGVTYSRLPSSEDGWQALLVLCAVKAELASTSQQLDVFAAQHNRYWTSREVVLAV